MPLSLDALRRYVVAQQGFATRPKRADSAALAEEVRRLQAVQLDSISAVERAHRLTLGSRLGDHPKGGEWQLLREGVLFEYWAHEACLLHVSDYPLMKRRFVHHKDHHWWGRERQHRRLEEEVLQRIRDEGPLPARAFAGANTKGEMWGWKPHKRALEDLFAGGELVIFERDGFQRVYELPERVIPKRYLDADAPSEEEFLERYALRAVEARGALTAQGVVEHCRFRGRTAEARAALARLVAEGALAQQAVDDGGPDVYTLPGAAIDGTPKAAVLLCPFENLLWDRPFAKRLFGFDYKMEIYLKPHERRYGYYVFPFLLGDRLVGRVDLKAERAEGALLVKAVHLEDGVRKTKALAQGLESALERLRRVVGVERVARV